MTTKTSNYMNELVSQLICDFCARTHNISPIKQVLDATAIKLLFPSNRTAMFIDSGDGNFFQSTHSKDMVIISHVKQKEFIFDPQSPTACVDLLVWVNSTVKP